MAKNTNKPATGQPKRGEPMDPNTRENRHPVARPNSERVCYAIKQLVSEVEALFPETTYNVSNYDGRNTATDVTFDVHESPGLAELLTLTEQDHRVADVIEDDGAVLVAMRPNPRTQDIRDSFGLGAAWVIIGEQFEGMEQGSW